MTQKRIELKEQIKSLATVIRTGRAIFANKEERNHLLAEQEALREAKDWKAWTAYKLPWYTSVESWEFRKKHVVASLLRGKTYAEIERSHTLTRALYIDDVKALIEEYKNEVPFDILALFENNKEKAFANLPQKEVA